MPQSYDPFQILKHRRNQTNIFIFRILNQLSFFLHRLLNLSTSFPPYIYTNMSLQLKRHRTRSSGLVDKDKMIIESYGHLTFINEENILKTNWGSKASVISVTIIIICMSLFGNENVFGPFLLTIPMLLGAGPFLVSLALLFLINKKYLHKKNIFPEYVPTRLYWCLFISYILILIQRLVLGLATGCQTTNLNDELQYRLGRTAKCALQCPFNSTYNFPQGGAGNTTLVIPQYICFNRAMASTALLTIITMIVLARTACLRIDNTATDATVLSRFEALKIKWPFVRFILNGDKIQLSALLAPAAEPALMEYFVGGALGLAASSTIMVDMVGNSTNPITAINIVYALIGLVSNVCNGMVLYILMFWRPYNVYKRVLATMITLDEFLTGSNKNLLCPLHVVPGQTKFLVADPLQLKAWMVSRQFLLNMLPAVYDAASQSLMVVIIAAGVSFTWSVRTIIVNYFNPGFSPVETLAANPAKVTETVTCSLVFVIWVLHLFYTVGQISAAQVRHADELEKALLALQLEPKSQELWSEEIEKLIESMVVQIRTRDTYPRVNKTIFVKPRTLYVLVGYFITGITTVLATQISTMSRAVSSLAKDGSPKQTDSKEPSTTFSLVMVFGSTFIYLALHMFHTCFNVTDTLIAEDNYSPLQLLEPDVVIENPAARKSDTGGGGGEGAPKDLHSLELAKSSFTSYITGIGGEGGSKKSTTGSSKPTRKKN